MTLIADSEVRFEGVLDTVDMRDKTLTLRQVRSFGTEGRRVPQIPPRAPDDVLDFMVFHGEKFRGLRALHPPEVGQLYLGDEIGPICAAGEKPFQGVRQTAPSGLSTRKTPLRTLSGDSAVGSRRVAFGRVLPEVPPWAVRLQQRPASATNPVMPKRFRALQPGAQYRHVGSIEAMNTRSFRESFGGLNDRTRLVGAR